MRCLLRPGGTLVVEHSERHGESVPAAADAAGFVDVAAHEDLTRRPRYTTGRRAMLTRVFDCSRDDEREIGLDEAATAVRRGELVVMPTDTVYGVAADAFSPAAVDALLAAKGRDRTMPVPVLVATPEMLDALVERLPDVGRDR